MENTTNHSSLRQKLDQHDMGYRPGAWENFETLLNANPSPSVAPKKSFWNLKKWFGVGAAAVFLSGGAIFYTLNTISSIHVDVATDPKDIELSTPTESNVEQKQNLPNTSTTTKKSKEKELILMQTASPQVEVNQYSQHDDNSLPHEGDLKIRPQQQYQRASKSGSDDSGVLPVSGHANKSIHESMVKKGADAGANKVPDAHDLEDAAKKPKQNPDF